MRRSRRTALNEAMHELRRPLQVLALAGSETAEPARIQDSVRLAAEALERLDREINGRPATAGEIERLAVGSLLAECVGRWQGPAAHAGRTLVLRTVAAEVAVSGDRRALAAALDNLVLNAIEHGGPRIVVAGGVRGGWLRISVKDCGRPLPLPGTVRGGRGPGLRGRLRGRARHGHGLRLVRRFAVSQGGRFVLTRSPGGATAELELPAA